MGDEKTPNKPFKAVLNNIVPAFKSAGFYTAIGLVLGFALVLLASAIEHSEDLKQIVGANRVHVAYLIIEHLGTGFIVSALAVFFYEWGAHIKHAFDLSKDLTEGVRQINELAKPLELTNELREGVRQIDNLVKTTNLSDRLVNVLTDEHTQRSKPEFRKSLEYLLSQEGEHPPPYLFNLRENIYSIVMAVKDIRKNNSWATEQYVEFINYLLTNVVKVNADTLEHVSKKQAGDYQFSVPPDGARMADEILATHMRALNSGDSYDVISHVTSWTRLDGFHNETTEAIRNRGVKVRRVFNFRIRYEEELKPEQMKQILNRQLEDVNALADENGKLRYEVKVIREMEMDQAVTTQNFRNLFSKSHFGTFIKNVDGGSNKSKIRVKVTVPDLSDMTLSSDEQVYKKDIDVFEEAWKIGSPLTKELIDSIIDQWQVKVDLPKQIEKIAEYIQADGREQSTATESDEKTELSEQEKATKDIPKDIK